MIKVHEQLWRRENAVFAVEILVGKTWVRRDAGHATELEATEASRAALLLPAVRAVRLIEVETVQTATVIATEEKGESTESAIGMDATGKKAPCPHCGEQAPVSFDGTTEWTVCGPCKRALPVSNA